MYCYRSDWLVDLLFQFCNCCYYLSNKVGSCQVVVHPHDIDIIMSIMRVNQIINEVILFPRIQHQILMIGIEGKWQCKEDLTFNDQACNQKYQVTWNNLDMGGLMSVCVAAICFLEENIRKKYYLNDFGLFIAIPNVIKECSLFNSKYLKRSLVPGIRD